MKKTIKHLWHIYRFSEWKQTVLVMVVCALIVMFLEGKAPDARLSLFIIYLVFTAIYGFLLNSYADRHSDRKVRKVYLYFFPKWFILLNLFLLAGLSLFLALAIAGLKAATVAGLVLVLTSAYSMRPVRLKERGLLGIIVLILTMMPLPFIIFLIAYEVSWLPALLMLGYLFLYSCADEIGHQLFDHDNDRKTNTRTWAVASGYSTVSRAWSSVMLLLAFYPLIAFFFVGFQSATVVFLALHLLSIEHYSDWFVRIR